MESSPPEAPPPREGTLDRWAFDFIVAADVPSKLRVAPPPEPAHDAHDDAHDAVVELAGSVGGARARAALVRQLAPGRPAHFTLAERAAKTPGPVALRDPRKRAALLHAFLHHEVQAAELFAWALLAFPEAPGAMRRGFASLVESEVRHSALYAARLDELGFAYGDFPVRDWFWQRVPRARSAAAFVATLGIGFEGANLDHAARFAALLEGAGDFASARLQRVVGREEIAHVHFAQTWFERLVGRCDFDTWRAHLPPPLSPIVMRGPTLDAGARRKAGLDAAFTTSLAEYTPSS